MSKPNHRHTPASSPESTPRTPKTPLVGAQGGLDWETEAEHPTRLNEDDGDASLSIFSPLSKSPEEAERDSKANSALETADDTSIREFYSQLVSLLTQDQTPQESKRKTDNHLWVALRRRWLPALVISIVAFVGLGYMLRPRQSTYSASVTLLLPPRESPNTQDSTAPPEDSYDIQAQLAILSSESLVESAMKKVPAVARAKGWGSTQVRSVPVEVAPLESESLIHIGVTSLDPRASLMLVNALVDTYTNYTRWRYIQNREDNLRISKRRVAISNRALEAARRQLRQYKEKTGVFDVAQQQGSNAQSIVELTSALNAARREVAVGAQAQNIISDTELNQLRQQELEARIRYQKELKGFFPTSDRVRFAEAQWRQAQQLAQSRRTELLGANKQRQSQLEASLKQARGRATSLPAIEQTLNKLNERIQTLQSGYETTNTRYNQFVIARDVIVPTAKKLHSPTVSSSRFGQFIRPLAVSLIAALGLGVLAAWWFERSDHSVRAIPDPDALFSAPVLGAMPAVRDKPSLFLGNPSPGKGQSTLLTATIEACHVTQSNIISAANAIGAHSILITSSLPEEGKSQCAFNIAAAMAYGTRRVLLLDLDFWHPTQHELLDMPLEPGYAQVLQGKSLLSKAIRATNIANLYLMSTGLNETETPSNILTLLNLSMHQQNLDTLKPHFDVIIIDSPPTMSIADAQLLSSLADSMVLVAADNTHRDQVHRARSMLRLAGGRLLGVVVNSARLNEINRWNLNFAPEEPFAEYASSVRRRGT